MSTGHTVMKIDRGGKLGFQTEQYRKYNGHTDEGGIGCHGYIFLDTS